jgi:hypothetical protein
MIIEIAYRPERGCGACQAFVIAFCSRRYVMAWLFACHSYTDVALNVILFYHSIFASFSRELLAHGGSNSRVTFTASNCFDCLTAAAGNQIIFFIFSFLNVVFRLPKLLLLAADLVLTAKLSLIAYHNMRLFLYYFWQNTRLDLWLCV